MSHLDFQFFCCFVVLSHCISVQVHRNEIVSQQHALDALIAEAPSTDSARTHLDNLKAQFTELVNRVDDLIDRVKSDVALHQSWHEMIEMCEERLAAARSTLDGIDACGDKIAIHAKLDSVQVRCNFI